MKHFSAIPILMLALAGCQPGQQGDSLAHGTPAYVIRCRVGQDWVGRDHGFSDITVFTDGFCKETYKGKSAEGFLDPSKRSGEPSVESEGKLPVHRFYPEGADQPPWLREVFRGIRWKDPSRSIIYPLD